ncbi:hypothetical protein DYB30_000963 [Aphanomyces astaci]|uniref:START domain-containing protein n=1 Tax=Aphanomyces astaci TaxID=112090 RepID=A0A397DU37_APHAT|nr:hypothetical protein DYB30_000963 [Aphanomyces astaci]RHZ40892.1 hypothetical protein DYB26_008869 [Aphanomyces astaci]
MDWADSSGVSDGVYFLDRKPPLQPPWMALTNTGSSIPEQIIWEHGAILAASEELLYMSAAKCHGDRIARTTVADNDKSGLIKWTLDCHDGEQTIYRGDDWDAPQGVQSFLGVFELKATLDEVAGLYACHTDDTMAEFRRSVAKNVLDMQQLYVLSAPSDDNPRHFVGIKWAAVASPGMVRHRDWVLLEVNVIDSTLSIPSSIVMKIATFV